MKLNNSEHNNSKNSEKYRSIIKEPTGNTGKNILSIDSDKLLKIVIFSIIGIEVILILLDLFISYGEIIPAEDLQDILSLSREQTLGTWFMTIQTFLAGFILLLIYFTVRKDKKGWLFLGLFFIYMSADDCASLHERYGGILNDLADCFSPLEYVTDAIEAFPSYLWIIIAGPFFLIAGIYMFYFLWKELKGLNLRIYLFPVLLFFCNAVLLDFMQGMKKPLKIIMEQYGLSNNTVLHFWTLAEESLEMLAISILLFIFLKYFFMLLKDREILFKNKS